MLAGAIAFPPLARARAPEGYHGQLHFRAVNRATGEAIGFVNSTNDPAFEFGSEPERQEFLDQLAVKYAREHGWRASDTDILGDGTNIASRVVAGAPVGYEGALHFRAVNRSTGQSIGFVNRTSDPSFEFGSPAQRAEFLVELAASFAAQHSWPAADTEITGDGKPSAAHARVLPGYVQLALVVSSSCCSFIRSLCSGRR